MAVYWTCLSRDTIELPFSQCGSQILNKRIIKHWNENFGKWIYQQHRYSLIQGPQSSVCGQTPVYSLPGTGLCKRTKPHQHMCGMEALSETTPSLQSVEKMLLMELVLGIYKVGGCYSNAQSLVAYCLQIF